MEKILIIDDLLPNGEDTSASKIGKKIEELGGSCIFLRYADLVNNKSKLSVSYVDGRQSILFCKNDVCVDLKKEISSVLSWRPRYPEDKIKGKLSGDELNFFYREWQNFLKSIKLCLKHCFWLNPFPQNIVYEEKLRQLEIAQKIGLKIPHSFITTSLSDASIYFKNIGEDVIYKPFTQGSFQQKDKDGRMIPYGLYTSIIDKKDLRDARPEFPTPNIFQVYVPKKVEIRITCVGKAVMACEIHSQDSEISKHDWRKYDLENTPYLKHSLPSDIEQYCLQLLSEFDLTYGCIDMVITPEDEYVFLELNPNGQFGWIEEMTKLPILENIARMLIAGSIDYDIKTW